MRNTPYQKLIVASTIPLALTALTALLLSFINPANDNNSPIRTSETFNPVYSSGSPLQEIDDIIHPRSYYIQELGAPVDEHCIRVQGELPQFYLELHNYLDETEYQNGGVEIAVLTWKLTEAKLQTIFFKEEPTNSKWEALHQITYRKHAAFESLRH